MCVTWSFIDARQIARIMLSPYILIRVEYLPVYAPSEEEACNPKLYAENVRKEFARASGESYRKRVRQLYCISKQFDCLVTAGLPLSPYGARSLRDEEKTLKKQAKRSAQQVSAALASTEL